MAMIRLTFFVPTDVLERYDALVYRSGVKRSQLLREALEHGLPGVRAALPGLRARYGEGRTVRRPRAMASRSMPRACECRPPAHRAPARADSSARMLLRRRPDIGWEDLRAALDESCAPNELGRARDELLDRVIARVHGDLVSGAERGFDLHAPLK